VEKWPVGLLVACSVGGRIGRRYAASLAVLWTGVGELLEGIWYYSPLQLEKRGRYVSKWTLVYTTCLMKIGGIW
jgi:hypothetical protein